MTSFLLLFSAPLGERLVCMEQRCSMHTNLSPNGIISAHLYRHLLEMPCSVVSSVALQRMASSAGKINERTQARTSQPTPQSKKSHSGFQSTSHFQFH